MIVTLIYKLMRDNNGVRSKWDGCIFGQQIALGCETRLIDVGTIISR